VGAKPVLLPACDSSPRPQADAEAALVVLENRLGGVVTLCRPDELASDKGDVSVFRIHQWRSGSVAVAAKFDRNWAMIAYAALKELLRALELLGSR
jgi:hypothetical protein